MQNVKQGIMFSTGKTRYSCSDILGISEDGHVFYGSDGSFYNPDNGTGDSSTDQPLTPVELIELADEMIERWSRLKQRATQSTPGT